MTQLHSLYAHGTAECGADSIALVHAGADCPACLNKAARPKYPGVEALLKRLRPTAPARAKEAA